MNFRSFAESKAYCGLALSPLIAAIADASEGATPSTISDAECLAHFGCDLASMPKESRRTVAVRAGGRGGKTSRLLAPKALHAAWTSPLPTLGRNEVASALLVAPDMKLARQALSFVIGYAQGSKILRTAIVGDPTKDALELRRPDGAHVRVEVLAATRGGKGVRGRTLVFAGLDEACFFLDEGSGVVNDADLYRAVLQRVVPGGQVWIASTPWLEDIGLLETTISKNWGTHTNALVATGGTRALNPTWDPTGEIERDLRETDPDAAIREIDGQPMSGGAGVFFASEAITACIDETICLPVISPGAAVAFGVDLGFVSDSSALVGVTTAKVAQVVIIDERRPEKGKPLKPREVIDAFAGTMRQYGTSAFVADGHYRESAREHLEKHDVELIDMPGGRDGKAEVFLHAKKMVHERRVRLPNHPRFLAQLRQIVSKPAPGGGMTISSPRRRGGGGHGDLVSAFVNALWQSHADEATPLWVRAMTQWRVDRNSGVSPGEIGIRERIPQPILITSGFDGTCTASGREAPFEGMRALWRHAGPSSFSETCTVAFRSAVAKLRAAA